jgi:hypothetical protein
MGGGMTKLNKKQRAELKQMFGGRCAYCGCELGEKWHADHVEPIIRGWKYVTIEKNGSLVQTTKPDGKICRPENNRADNLFPACVPCNIHKHSMSIEVFRKVLMGHVAMMNKTVGYSTYRHAKRFGLIKETEQPVIFFYETYGIEHP